MLLLKSLALFAAAVAVTGQAIDSLPKCAQDCYYSSRDGSAECTGADQANMACLCPKVNFFNAIHDCARNACTAEVGGDEQAALRLADTAKAAASALCATATAGAPAATSATPENPDAAAPPASTPAPETPAGETQPAASPVPSAVATEPSTSVPTDPATTSEPAATSTSESSVSTGVSAIVPVPTGGSSTSSASAPASTSKDKDENEDEKEDEDKDDNEGGGLSTSAKAGIGAGIGVGSLVLFITAALWIFKKRSTPKDHIKISDPVAGGRHYASDPYNHNNFSRATSQGGIAIMSENELEMKSRRYEDMVPRQQPRNMV